MAQAEGTGRKQAPIVQFFAGIFDLPAEEFRQVGDLPEGEVPRMAGVMRLQNQPEFWADAPWRVEPDQEAIPVSFHVRDATIQPPGKGPWRLDMLRVEQQLPDGDWFKLATFLPTDLPNVDGQGNSQRDFWAFGAFIPVQHLKGIRRGDRVHLRAVFVGRFPAEREPATTEVHLETFLAEHPLPLSRAAQRPGARQWFHGDTHYHSAHTNDVKEFGGAILEARKAGQAIGLDWLIITDHSCDLDDIDEQAGGLRRWDRLKADIASPQISGGVFRCILGEEITLLGKSGKPLHMLAFGSLDDLVEGAFLPAATDNPEIELVRRAVEHIIRAGRGYAADIPERLFGKIWRLEEVMDKLPQETLAFAAHPFDVAQVPPARWRLDDLCHPRLTGYEFWNGRTRASASMTYNPFATPGWKNPAKLRKADAARIEKFRQHAQQRWDPQLQRGVEEWPEGEERPTWRPVLIGGSDAHCDFNYHVGWAWDYRKFEANDGAFGRVRTVIHLPDHAASVVPEADQILAAMKKGACVVTDGPVVEFWLEQGGRTARLGDVLAVSGDGDVEIKVVVHTTPEFGPAQEIAVVSYTSGHEAKQTVVRAGGVEAIGFDGARGYLRVEAQTVGAEGEAFYCFTNPIWVRLMDGQKRQGLISPRLSMVG